MADRRAAPSRSAAMGLSQGPSTGAAKSRSEISSVRRNLFQSQLTRRPTSNSSTSGETLHLDNDVAPDSEDLVIRDTNGEIELDDPPTLPMDDQDEEMAPDAGYENERERQRLADAVKQHQIDQNSVPAHPQGARSSGLFGNVASPSPAADAYRAELLDAVRASMRAKVAALSEDNWMYEREDNLRRR